MSQLTPRVGPTGHLLAYFDDDAEPTPVPDVEEAEEPAEEPVAEEPVQEEPEVPSDEEMDAQAYERLKARHPYLFQPAQAQEPRGGKPKQEDYDTWDGYVEAVAEWTADQRVGQVQAVQDTRDAVGDLLSGYGADVKAHARQVMRGWSKADLAHPNAANTIANLVIGELSRSGKLTRAKAPTGQGANPPAPVERMDPDLEIASRLMGVKFTAADLKAAGIGGRN